MSLPREPFTWDGDDDPISLDAARSEDGTLILGDAETLVRDGQDEVAREDTEKVVVASSSGEKSTLPVPRAVPALTLPTPRVALPLLLALACALAFLHGWSTGATASGLAPSSRCDAPHCEIDPTR